MEREIRTQREIADTQATHRRMGSSADQGCVPPTVREGDTALNDGRQWWQRADQTRDETAEAALEGLRRAEGGPMARLAGHTLSLKGSRGGTGRASRFYLGVG